MRAFVAIPLCSKANDVVADLQADLDQGRLVAQENFHVTLAFLDDQPEVALTTLNDVLAEIRVDDVTLGFSGVEVRGGRQPAVIWAGIEHTEALKTLQVSVRGAIHAAGLDRPRTRFRPHVTLARIGRSVAVDRARLAIWLARHGTFRAGPFPVKAFCLYVSQLGPHGPVYETLAEYPLTHQR